MNMKKQAVVFALALAASAAGAAQTWYVRGGTEAFRSFLKAAGGPDVTVETFSDMAYMPFDTATNAVFFVLPDYEKGKRFLPDLGSNSVRAEKALERGNRLYVENSIASGADTIRLLGAEVYGTKPVRISQEYIEFNDDVLQARLSSYLPAGTRSPNLRKPAKAVASVSDCLGVHGIRKPGTHRLPVLVASHDAKVHAAFIDFSRFDPHSMRPYVGWKAFYPDFLKRVAGADPKRVAAAFAATYPDFMGDSNGTDAETLVRRAMAWHQKSGVLIAPDGTKGMYEAIVSDTLGYRKGLRGDCHFLTAALFACAGKRYGIADWTRIGTNLADFALSRGFQTKEGFIRWFDRECPGYPGHTVYSSDMGRSSLGLINLYKATGEERYLVAARKAAEAFLLWMDGRGLNSGHFDRVDDGGWKGRGTSDNPVFYAEMISFLLQLGEKKYTDAALLTLDKINEKFPDVAPFGFSDNFTYSRYLMMLACAQRASDRDYSERINRTLSFFTKHLHPTGGIEETPIRLIDDGEAGIGMGDGSDHITDILYCDYLVLNALSVMLKLPESRRGTVDLPAVRKLYAALRAFLLKVQIASDDPRFDGAWMRAYDMDIGEYYGLDKDTGWGAYCIETGWVTGFIPLVFMYEDASESFFFR